MKTKEERWAELKADIINFLLLKLENRSLLKEEMKEKYSCSVHPGEKPGTVCLEIRVDPNC